MGTTKENRPTVNGAALEDPSAGTHSTTALDIALELARKGYHVFPATVTRKANGDKDVKPRVAWGMASTTLPGMISEWWKQWPKAQVCIDCGKSGIAVVDCDVKHSDGHATWLDLAPSERGSESLETTSGGRHYFYRQPDGERLRNDQDGRIADGVDLRGDGGMVIVHPAGYGDVLGFPSPSELMPVPDVVVRKMRGAPLAETLGFDPDFSPEIAVHTGEERTFTVEQAQAFVKDQAFTPLALARPGEINGALNRAACVLSHFGPEFWSREQAEKWLLEAQRRVWVEHGGEDDEDYTAALKTIRSGMNQKRDPWRATLATEPRVQQDDNSPIVDPSDPVQLEYERLKVRREAVKRLDEEEAARRVDADTIDALRAELLRSSELDQIKDLVPLVDEWLFQDSLARIVGKSGCGKTFVTLDMALCVASKRPWFGWGTNGGPVVYVVAEGARGVRKRIRAWEWQHNDGRPVDDLYVLPRAVQMLEDDYLALIAVAKQLGAVMVVLDTQARVTVGVDENSATDMGRVVAAADRLRNETGACVVLVHHVGYQGGHARGSTAVYGANQTELEVVRDEGMRLTIRTSKQKDHDEREARMKLVELNDSLVLANLDAEDRKESEDTRVGNAIDLTVRDGERLSDQLARVIHSLSDGTRSGVSFTTVRDTLNQSRLDAGLLPYLKTSAPGKALGQSVLRTALKRMEVDGHVERPSSATYRLSESGCRDAGLTYTPWGATESDDTQD